MAGNVTSDEYIDTDFDIETSYEWKVVPVTSSGAKTDRTAMDVSAEWDGLYRNI